MKIVGFEKQIFFTKFQSEICGFHNHILSEAFLDEDQGGRWTDDFASALRTDEGGRIPSLEVCSELGLFRGTFDLNCKVLT